MLFRKHFLVSSNKGFNCAMKSRRIHLSRLMVWIQPSKLTFNQTGPSLSNNEKLVTKVYCWMETDPFQSWIGISGFFLNAQVLFFLNQVSKVLKLIWKTIFVTTRVQESHMYAWIWPHVIIVPFKYRDVSEMDLSDLYITVSCWNLPGRKIRCGMSSFRWLPEPKQSFKLLFRYVSFSLSSHFSIT